LKGVDSPTRFDRRGRVPDDEPEFSELCARFDGYAAYFAALGMTLVRHEREFFHFEPDNPENVPDTLPRIAVFSCILVDHAANQEPPIEKFIFGQNFLVTALPHFALDRYTALLRQVDVHDLSDLKTLLKHVERIGWVKWLGEEEFRFLRPFHRVFSKCLELAQSAPPPDTTPINPPGVDDSAAASRYPGISNLKSLISNPNPMPTGPQRLILIRSGRYEYAEVELAGALQIVGPNNQVREPRDVTARLALKQFRAIKSAQEQKELLLPAVNGEGRGLGIVALCEASISAVGFSSRCSSSHFVKEDTHRLHSSTARANSSARCLSTRLM
jgi:Condensin complex protein MksE